MPSFPPPKITIKSFIATARWPCLGRGQGPDAFVNLFHFNMGAAILKSPTMHLETRMPKQN